MVILGSTGSIGTQALDIARRNPARFRVAALAAGGGNPGAARPPGGREFGVAAVAVADPAAAPAVESALKEESSVTYPGWLLRRHASPRCSAGPDAVCHLAALARATSC